MVEEDVMHTLKRRGGGVVLVDTPGYGFAVGEKKQLRQWRRMLVEYISDAPLLRLAVVLIDSTRGMCEEDAVVLKLLTRKQVPLLPVLTKTDLLSPEQLACSHQLVAEQLSELDGKMRRLPMVSSLFFLGISHFWRRLVNEIKRAPTSRQSAATPIRSEADVPTKVNSTAMTSSNWKERMDEMLRDAPDERAIYASRKLRKRARCKQVGSS